MTIANRGARLSVLPACRRLSRQATLVDLQVDSRDEADVSWDTVSGCESNDVSWDEFVGEEVEGLAIAVGGVRSLGIRKEKPPYRIR